MVKKSKHILIFAAFMLPHLGGIERYVDNLLKQLVLMGYKPIVVTSNYDNLKSEETKNGVKIFRLPIFNFFKDRYPILKNNKKTKEILRKLDKYEIKSIIVNTRFHLTSHIGANYGKKRNIPVYLIEHGSNYVTLDNKFIDFFANRYEDFLTWKLKKKVKDFYGVSDACGNWLKKFNIKSAGTWYNSIDYNQEKPSRKPHKNINFMYAGRILKQKGVKNILDSFNDLEKKYDNIHLFIAGNGPELEIYKEKYESENIEFLGKLEYKELLNYYAKTDVFLYPPLWPEGLPTSILEAGLMKCAVIGTDQGGIKEIIVNGKNGVIIKQTKNAIQVAMENLINDKNLIKKYATDLNKTIKYKFSWENTAKKILRDMGVE